MVSGISSCRIEASVCFYNAAYNHTATSELMIFSSFRRQQVGESVSPVPVSYTHLDVYKRQALDKPDSHVVLTWDNVDPTLYKDGDI